MWSYVARASSAIQSRLKTCDSTHPDNPARGRIQHVSAPPIVGCNSMSRPFIVLGDKTSHGGTVISASGSSDSNGKGIARVGDKVTCPKKGHGHVTVIASGDPTTLVDGRPAARHGDTTACGATLIASQQLTTDHL